MYTPWSIDFSNINGHLGWSILDSRGFHVSTVYADHVRAPRPEGGEFAQPDNAPSIARARHIVACVNGCEGINPEAIKDLLETMEKVRQWISGYAELQCCVEWLDAAIAKAKGQKEG